jgi:hypothetical protein
MKLARFIIAIIALTMTSCTDNSPESKFWNWFETNHERFRSVDEAEDLLDLFEAHLHEYDAELFFEISEPLDDGSNELIITAEGVMAKFPKVEALVAAAPAIPNWKVIAFKPAIGFNFVHEYGDLKLDPGQLWFLPLRAKSDPKILGLRIGVPDFDESDVEQVKNSLWIILDTGLGERVCSERIKRLEVALLPETPEDEGYIELPELSEYLGWRDRTDSDPGAGPNGDSAVAPSP